MTDAQRTFRVAVDSKRRPTLPVGLLRQARLDAASEAAQQAAAADVIRRLSIADLCCLAHAVHLGLPVLTGDRHWLGLGTHGLTVDVFDHRDPALTP